MKVNMTPNPLDVVTIHASQGDTEARQWEFELHNNGELIDTSDVTEQLVIKAYKGGTEQLLPENTSTPTTSPFLGDIRYPQGLLTDQEFTYRQSPTEEDGLAKITEIKGNTIVWNQLVQNGNFEITTGWATSGRGTLTVSNNIATITPLRSGLIVTGPVISIKQGHKYLLSVEVKADSTSVWVGTQYNNIHARLYSNGTNQWQRITAIVSNFANDSQSAPVFGDGRSSGWTASQIRNFMFIDLTQIGLDSITDPSDFTSLFNLPYYAYNQGSLLSFMGNGIKTVGKNLIDPSIIEYGKNWSGDDNASRANYSMRMPYGQYTFSIQSIGTLAEVSVSVTSEKYGERSSLGGLTNSAKRRTVTVDANHPYVQFLLRVGSGTVTQADFESCSLMLESGSVTSEYEPYTSSTLSLPISTYFPNGMKSARNAYDELTPIEASARIGGQTWNGTESFDVTNTRTNTIQFARGVSPLAKSTSADAVGNVVSNFFLPDSLNNVYSQDIEGIGIDTSGRIRVTILKSRLPSADVAGFKSWLTSNNLTFYYEMATPTETSFTTASLVTENAEIPLSNNDGVLLGKCTEELSENPGFIDAKIKLSDSDGECYSNKIQLHVERKPS